MYYIFWYQYWNDKNVTVPWSGNKCVFLIKKVLYGGIRAISFGKKTVLNRGPCSWKPCYSGISCTIDIYYLGKSEGKDEKVVNTNVLCGPWLMTSLDLSVINSACTCVLSWPCHAFISRFLGLYCIQVWHLDV